MTGTQAHETGQSHRSNGHIDAPLKTGSKPGRKPGAQADATRIETLATMARHDLPLMELYRQRSEGPNGGPYAIAFAQLRIFHGAAYLAAIGAQRTNTLTGAPGAMPQAAETTRPRGGRRPAETFAAGPAPISSANIQHGAGSGPVTPRQPRKAATPTGLGPAPTAHTQTQAGTEAPTQRRPRKAATITTGQGTAPPASPAWTGAPSTGTKAHIQTQAGTEAPTPRQPRKARTATAAPAEGTGGETPKRRGRPPGSKTVNRKVKEQSAAEQMYPGLVAKAERGPWQRRADA